MKLKEKALSIAKSTPVSNRMICDKRYRIITVATASFALNLCYALHNGVIGIFSNSPWFITMCAYYIILSTMRFSAVLSEKRNKQRKSSVSEIFIMRFSGALLMILSGVLSISIYISFKAEVTPVYHEIVMITIATYTFYKTTMAIINAVKVRKTKSPLLITIKNISCADAGASMLSLQRSMFASFSTKDLDANKVNVMNALLGAFVCVFVLVLGFRMAFITYKRRKNYGKIKNSKSKRKNC